jgi:predicted aspartyl protease
MPKAGLAAMFLAAALLASGVAQADGEKCSLGRFAALPITIDDAGGIAVPMNIDDQKQNMLIDTGGIYSMLTNAAAARLGLKPKMLWGVSFTMWGGRTLDHYVTTHSFEIAGGKGHDRDFVILPDDLLPPGVDGILGPDIMQVFDIEFDFAAGKVGLFSQKHCEGKVVYWTQDPFAVVPFKMDESWHIKIAVQLDGQEVLAILDTGAYRSAMSLETAEDMFKIDPAVLTKNNGRHPFKTLTLQGVSVNNPDIVLVPDDSSKVMGGYRQPKLILGMGVLRQLHVYIAYKEHNIYATAASAH